MKIFTALILVLLTEPVMALNNPVFVNGQIPSDDHSAPTATLKYDRDCAGKGKATGMNTTIVSAASGVGSVLTITETDGLNTWISTVDTSVANTTKTTCAQQQ